MLLVKSLDDCFPRSSGVLLTCMQCAYLQELLTFSMEGEKNLVVLVFGYWKCLCHDLKASLGIKHQTQLEWKVNPIQRCLSQEWVVNFWICFYWEIQEIPMFLDQQTFRSKARKEVLPIAWKRNLNNLSETVKQSAFWGPLGSFLNAW